MRAVVFDLFGTLTDPAVEVTRRHVVAPTATAMGVNPDRFWTELRTTWGDRITGRPGGTAATLAWLARRCSAAPTAEQLDRALTVHLEGARELRAPRPSALPVLNTLRERGYRLGLISDCTSELAEEWDSTPFASLFNAVVLSWNTGLSKPDPRLYAAVTDQLAVPVYECWYVGDGGGRELQGARQAGMTPVLVTNAAVPAAAQHRIHADDYLPPHQIDDLPQLLDLVESASA